MYSSVLKKWRAREAEEAKLLRPADTLTRSFGSKHCCSWQHRWTADLIAMLFFYDFIIFYHLEIHEDSEENMKL
jgi:hypothetical protein